MSNSFPILTENQVVLSRADINTGIVLDENLLYATDLSQIVYTIYPDLETAIEAAKLIVTNKPNVECYIHNKDNVLLDLFDCNTKI
jgi:hypothetical protein